MSELTDKYKTFWRRCLAHLIDTAIVILPIIFVQSAIRDPSYDTRLLFAAIPIVVWIIYKVIMQYNCGQTVGKRATKVIVINSNGDTRLSLKAVLMRELLALIAPCIGFLLALMYLSPEQTFTIYMEVDDGRLLLEKVNSLSRVTWEIICVVVILANEQRMAPHDQFARTVVVRLESLNDIPPKYQK